ncbi:MAG: gliding motility-associated C-terminal domain-containing protein [Bacteroidia bacterium]
MKKHILSALLFFSFLFSSYAGNLYWIGGSGSWTDASHWSATSGGIHGFFVPTANDNVFFDKNSFNWGNETVQISGSVNCRNLVFTNNILYPVLQGTATDKLNIYGSLNISSDLKNNFLGSIYFKSGYTGNIINIDPSESLTSDVYFDNAYGSWSLNNPLVLRGNHSINLIAGNFISNGQLIDASLINAPPNALHKSLNLANSAVCLTAAFSGSGNISNYNITHTTFSLSRIVFSNTTQSGGYSNVTLFDLPGSDSIHIKYKDPLCNGQCNGQLITFAVYIIGGVGPYTYQWIGPPNASGDTLNNACAGNYAFVVTDLGNGSTKYNFRFVITVPSQLLPNTAIKKKPTCFGDCNGGISISFSGGVTPYAYSWFPSGETTYSATNLCAGGYTITATDANGCTSTSSATITQPLPIAPNPTFTNVTCNGFCNGTATCAPTGGNNPSYTYSWSNGQTTQSISNLCPGTYTITVKDDSLCSGTATVLITQPPKLILTPSSSNVTCFGLCNGSVSVAPVSGGTAPYTYSWTPSTVVGTGAATLCIGTYSVTVTDANGCSATASFNITQPAKINPNATSTNVKCFGSCTGTASSLPSGGTGAYTYSWSPGAQTSSSISNLCLGIYTVTVTDANGCTGTQSVTIVQPAAPLKDSLVLVKITCNGSCNGSITDFTSGGTPAYTYSWSSGQTTSAISGLCAGTYVLTVKDVNGCTSSQSITLIPPPVLTVSPTGTNISCNGACNGSVTANPSGGTPGYTYSWSPGAQTTSSVANLCAGTYTVTVTDANGCTQTGKVKITQPNVLTVGITPSPAIIACNGNCNASISSNVNGGTAGYTYSWSPGAQTTPTLSGLCAGTYSLTVTDANGCTANTSVTITQSPLLSLLTTNTPPSCNGKCDGIINAVASGGTGVYTYSWSPGGQTSATINNLCAGTYKVIVTDANGCKDSATVTLIAPQPLNVAIVVKNASCSGTCDGKAVPTVTGGTAPYTYLWMPGSLTTDSILNLCAGNGYSLKVTDANGCFITANFSITQPTLLSVSVTSTTSSCNICNGSASVTAVGGTSPYTYSWSNGQTTANATALCVGSYTVTIKDADGCIASKAILINPTVNIIITSSSNSVSCFNSCDGTATANAAGGVSPYTYSWNPSGETTQTATGLCSGVTYTITATDANGCFNTSTVVFSNPPQLTLNTSQTNISCNGGCNGTGTVTASGGTGTYTYSWSGGQTTSSINSLCAGTYLVTVKDANGCSAIDSVKIIQAPPIADNPTVVKADCSMNDGSITLAPTGGVPAYTYLWSPGGQTTSSITNIVAGIYTVSITDAAGCVKVFQIAVGNVTGPVLIGGFTPVSCNGSCDGTATVTASGGNPGYTYSWSPAGQTTNSISNLCSGLYIAKVTDASGCMSFDTITVTTPLKISPNATVVSPSCNGGNNGSISFSPTGGTSAYTYAWNPSVSVTSVANNLSFGTYSVTITDSKGCDTAVVINIVQPTALSVIITATNVTCNGSCNGKTTANVTGGTGAYTYSWSNGATQPSDVNLCPGTYTLTVTDANGCTVTQQAVITQPPLLSSSVVYTNVKCNLSCDGTANPTVTGGTSPYTYSWTSGQTTQNVNTLCAGSYTLTVTDANGCTSQNTVVITQPAKIAITIPNAVVSCNASCDAMANPTVTGGTSPYTYSWSNGQTTQNANNLCPGSYNLVVTDANGCSANQNVTITAPLPITENITHTDPSCVGSCNGTASSNPIGGTSPYTYQWLPGNQSTQNINGLCAGIYTLIVTDAHSCADTEMVTIANPSVLTITPTTAAANCGTCNGAITAVPSGGVGAYTYSWIPGGQTTSTINNVCAGIYTVTVTDANGCSSKLVIPLSNSSGPSGDMMTQTNVSCNGSCNGTITDVPSGGVSPYTYSWTPGGQTSNAVSNLCAGKYFVQITDANGCIRIDSTTIVQPGPLNTTPTTVKATCAGVCNGSITLTVSGGTLPYTYSWNTGQTTSSLSNLCPGEYVYNITDANACTFKDSVAIVPTTILTAPVSVVPAGCNGICNGSATITPAGGSSPYTYQWNDSQSQTTATASALCAGNYTVTVTDANGCTAAGLATILQNSTILANPTVTASTCGMCNGQITLAPSGGTAPYTYMWSSGQTSSSANGLCAGVYDVNITDNKGCTSTTTITVNSSGGPTVTITSTNATCFGTCNGTATAIPSGGSAPYTYLWIPGGQTTNSVNSLCAGIYNVQVIDSAGCSTIKTVIITSNQAFTINQSVSSTPCGLCNGSISVNPMGGTAPYTYLWAPGAQTTATINSLCAGTYTVTVTDASSCKQTFAIPVNNPTSPTVNITTTNITCNGTCNGSATAMVSGGVSPYTYSWSNGQIGATDNGLCAGNYSLKVTDNAGCVRTLVFTITTPTSITFSKTFVSQPKCAGSCNGIITVIPSGGTLPFTYVWNPAISTTATASNLCAGSYSVTVTDANGCATPQQTFILINPTPITVSHIVVNTACNTANNGSITETVGGGTPPYSFQWSGSSLATTQSLMNILPGDYILTVTDANGCSIKDSAIVTAAVTTLVEAGNDTSFCQSGNITLKATGNVGGLTYQWFQLPGMVLIANTQSVSVNPPTGTTDYVVVATNGTCPDADTVSVTSNPLPVVNMGANQTIVIYTSITIGGSPTGPPGSTYSWHPTTGLSDSTAANPVATPLTTTTYTVTVTNASGCSERDSVTITVLPEISFPNGITPNGDGKNDTWIIDNIQYFPKCLVEIYNRWGELLFSSPGYITKWDGTYNAKPLPVGTYYYIINLNDPRFPNVYTGPITILR